MNCVPDFSSVADTGTGLLRRIWVIIEGWISSALVGLADGWVRGPGLVYVELFRDTPMLIQFLWRYYSSVLTPQRGSG